MIRFALFSLAVAFAGEARAADQAAAGATDQPVATGSPSNATATVSPSSVAEAVTRADDTDLPETGASVFGLSLGTSIARGNFGSGQDSRLISTALGARYAIGTLRLSASMPYLNIRSRGVIFSGIDSTPVIAAGAKPGPRVTNDGIGDLTLGAAYTLPQSGSAPEIELSGRVKLPTATKSSQLSTRKTDYSAGIQITKAYGPFAPFVSATYRIFGDPAAINLRNGLAVSAGTSIALDDRTVALFSYHYAAKVSRLVRESHELFAGVSRKVPRSDLRLTGFVTAGISKGAAASSGGLSLSIDF